MPLRVIRGSTRTIGPIEVRDHLVQLVDLTGATVYVAVRSPLSGAPSISKVSSAGGSGIVIEAQVGATLGQFTVAFQPAETRTLVPGEYVWDAWAIAAGGVRHVVVDPSRFQLVREISAIPA